jgi:S-adenosylmethionine:tRNA ribosyltransferase-isomerase
MTATTAMTAVTATTAATALPVVRAPSLLSAPLDPAHEAHEPAEVRGRDRADVRLLVSHGATDVVHGTVGDLPAALRRGDVVVVNTSATIPAAIGASLPDGAPVAVHFSTEMPGGFWLVEVRAPAAVATVPRTDDLTGADLRLAGGGRLTLLDRLPGSQRLWLASPHVGGTVLDHLDRFGEPIRYRHAPGPWPISAYQQIFGTEPGSAEMPSAARPFTPEIVLDLARRGVTIATILLHAGVSSLEAHEMPYPERYAVTDATAAHVNATRRAGGRVIAVGTTVVRALESVVDGRGTVHPGHGWTDLVVTPERGVRAVDGLVTGWHEPEASHLLMLEAIAGRPALELAYGEARAHGYLWHEFGDSHLILPAEPAGREAS